MGKNRTSNNSFTPTNTLLGSQLENIPQLQDAIVDMNNDELKELVDKLKNNIIHYMKRGDIRTQYYELNDGTRIPQHASTVSGDKLLEDYTGDTYQNEYYRQLHQFLSDIEYELYERDIPYELEDNPIPDSVVPVIVRD